MSPKKTRSIEEDTGIIPGVLAENVVARAFKLIDVESSAKDLGFYSGRLVETSERHYKRSAKFRSKVRSEKNNGNYGRDYLCGFMQHWLSSLLLAEGNNRPEWRRALVDSGFSVGADVP